MKVIFRIQRCWMTLGKRHRNYKYLHLPTTTNYHCNILQPPRGNQIRRRHQNVPLSNEALKQVLSNHKDGLITMEEAETLLNLQSTDATGTEISQVLEQQNNEQILQSFATLDHYRSIRTGFPEVVYGEGKTAGQIALILDDMAQRVNNKINGGCDKGEQASMVSNSILATR
jgi:hypothetical protein